MCEAHIDAGRLDRAFAWLTAADAFDGGLGGDLERQTLLRRCVRRARESRCVLRLPLVYFCLWRNMGKT